MFFYVGPNNDVYIKESTYFGKGVNTENKSTVKLNDDDKTEDGMVIVDDAEEKFQENEYFHMKFESNEKVKCRKMEFGKNDKEPKKDFVERNSGQDLKKRQKYNIGYISELVKYSDGLFGFALFSS